ncbi:hypothetical protein CKO51_11020 [Rhodopirellula sp. SM50]|nr:hypothetical protein [Rhodopirellula sp. SM50]PAY19402.1 hypothetical protein CKO51_11020 [Rhodopirellula sp. SM50]
MHHDTDTRVAAHPLSNLVAGSFAGDTSLVRNAEQTSCYHDGCKRVLSDDERGRHVVVSDVGYVSRTNQ